MTNPSPTEPTPSEVTPTEPEGYLASLRFYLFTPWWRGAWFIGAIVWGVVLNVLFVTSEPREELFGVLSVIPIFAFIIEQQGRARKLRQDKAKLRNM